MRDDGPAETQPFDSFDDADAFEPLDADASEPLDPFERLVEDALDGLPDPFRDRLGTVAIVIEDEPNAGQLASVGAPGLFGLYTGVPRTAPGAAETPLPSKITIFRGPHVRAYPTPDLLAAGVADTVRHEIAHHFGISDARLRDLAAGHRGSGSGGTG